MLKAYTHKLKYSQKGITGIETAIILIAFVVVAAVFAYAVLSAGLYSSQKSQEAVYEGLKTAEGTVILKGGMVAVAANPGDTGYISQLSFTVGLAMTGDAIDFTPPATTGTDGLAPSDSTNKVVLSYIDSYQKVDDLFWTCDPLGSASDDYLLDPDEQFQITIGSDTQGASGGNLEDALTHHLGINTKFTIEIKTAVGSTLTLERTTPAYLSSVMNFQ